MVKVNIMVNILYRELNFSCVNDKNAITNAINFQKNPDSLSKTFILYGKKMQFLARSNV